MAGVAKLPPGVFLSVYLRKALGLGNIFGVTTNAKMGDVRLLRGQACGVIGVLGERPVAGFTVDVGVNAFGFGVGDIGMAAFAGLVAGVSKGTRRDLADGVTTVVTIAPETFRNEGAAKDQEEDQTQDENTGHTEQVGDVLKLNHS